MKMSDCFPNRKRFLSEGHEAQAAIIAFKKVEMNYFVKKISNLYEDLCEITDNINRCYSIQVLLKCLGF